jgi:betaine-aldehyde dehydrogenase
MNAKLWIGGRPVSALSGATATVLNPADGRPLARVAEAGPEDADAAARAADRAQNGPWSKFTPRQRARCLFEIARLIRENARELALLETRNAGKPLADSRDEIGLAADTFEYYAGAVTKHFGETLPVSAPGLAFTLRQPVGVSALITPWNFPLVIAAWKLAPALACGNAVVLKPAPETPLTALRLAELCAEAGVPEGVVNVLTGGPAAGAALVAHPLTRKVSFTGSTATGASVMRAAADGIKRVSLELGGKSPSLVFADADLELCAEKSVWAVFGNAGQDCCARSRVLVERKAYDRFLSLFAARARKVVVGHPERAGTQVGPLISGRQHARVSGFIAAGKASGARLVCGGVRPKGVPAGGHYLTPAVFAAAGQGSALAREEIFGPVAAVIPFRDEEEAVRLANDSAYGLSGSVWTRDLARGLRVARAVQSGVLSVNSSSSVFLEAPFGGMKGSGLGRELGMKALDLFSEVKSVFVATN